MSDERLRRVLDDYLDDRLESAARRRFEERLATDDGLARELALALQLRAELRAEEAPLSEAFYTRAVAHFSSARRRRLPFGLSWSTAGLAVATIAAAAIFIPTILRDGVPGMPENPAPVEERLSTFGEDRTEKKEHATAKTAAAADDELRSEPSKDALGRDAGAEAEPRFKNVAGGAGERTRQTAANGPLVTPEREPLSAPKPEADPALAREPVAKLRAEGELEEPNVKSDEQRLDRSELDKVADADSPVDAGYFTVSMPAAVELPVDLAGRGEIQVLDAGDPALQAARGNKKKESRTELHAQARESETPAHRFVAIGPRPGLDACSALRVRRTDTTWEIRFEETGSRVGSVSCGIEIPGDGAAIRFQGWPVDE